MLEVDAGSLADPGGGPGEEKGGRMAEALADALVELNRSDGDPCDLGILGAVGNTPLVRLNRILGDRGFELYAKLEAFNPGGSSKDRPATAILRHCLESGAIDRRTVVIESSSGNMGIGLAQACRYFGLRFICVVDPKTAPQN